MTPVPHFSAYEAAVDLFQRTVGIGAKITAIRSPRKLLDEFSAEFPHETRYAGAPVELAEQDHVSVRGTTIAGYAVECPEQAALRCIPAMRSAALSSSSSRLAVIKRTERLASDVESCCGRLIEEAKPTISDNRN